MVGRDNGRSGASGDDNIHEGVEPDELVAPSTRREFLLRGGAAVLAAGATGNLLGETAARAEPSGAAGLVAGGQLRVGILGFPVSWDSAFATNTATFLIRNVLDPLVQLTEKLAPRPGLARTWQSRSGGRIWDFSLATNAKWHDGVPFTSRDVVVHFQRILNPATGSAGADVYAAVASVEARGKHAVRFHLKAPDGEFPLLLGLYQGNVQAAHLDPKTLGKNSMVGTGPFRWGRIVPGQSLTLNRNPSYFIKGEPHLDSLVFVTFTDDQARLNALSAGTIDVAPDVPGDLAQQVRGGARLAKSLAGGHTAIYLRGDQKPGSDPRVIQALKMSVDRPALVQAALRGFGTPTGDNPVVPGSPAYTKVPIPKRNVQRAKALLAAAGYPNGVALECFVPGGRPSNEQLALGIQSMAGEAGFKITITTIPADVFYSKYWLKQTFGVDQWGARPTLDSQFRIAYTCQGIWNESHWCDKTFDTLLNRAHVETNPKRRAKLSKQVQQYFAAHANVLIPYHFPVLSAYRSSVHGFKETPIILYTNFRQVSKTG